MDTISVLRLPNVTGHARVWGCSLAAAGLLGVPAGAAPVLPRPDVSVQLRDGRFLHLAPLPFGALAAVPVGAAHFDESGTRAVMIAQFPGAAIHGDWRSANPTFAYLIDAQRRVLTQLSTGGRARAVTWSGANSVSIAETANAPVELAVVGAGAGALPPGRLDDTGGVPAGSVFVSDASTDRLAVYKTTQGRYAVVQIGARRFRIGGTARNGAYAIIGGYLTWIDGQRHIPAQIARLGPDLAQALSFAGSPYGDALAPILPLGIPVYQAAYRNGVAYFAFSYGVQRIVAATHDLVNFWFPALPHEPVFTVGDGLGVSPDRALYFIRPEEDVMLFTRSGHYVRAAMTGLDAARDPRPLSDALKNIDPTENALHTALLEWRFYPVGNASGQRWIGSRLGHVLVGDSSGRFTPGHQPAFPFALLGRTDDGRLWGAAPLSVQASASRASALWSSRDGATWQRVAVRSGDIGAVGSHGGAVWVALTRPWHGRPMIWLDRLRLSESNAELLAPTGGTYAGEQLSFADLPGGFYLIWGATPGWRLDGQGGPLSGFRIDEKQLGALDAAGDDVYSAQRLAPQTDPSMPTLGTGEAGVPEFLTLPHACTSSTGAGAIWTIATSMTPDPASYPGATVMSLDQEAAFEMKYAGRPFPLEVLTAELGPGDSARVTRQCESGPLRSIGTIERWTKDQAGTWRLSEITETYRY